MITRILIMAAASWAVGVGASAAQQPTIAQIVEASNPAAVAMRKYFPQDFDAMIKALEASPARDVATVRATALPFVTRVMAAHSSQIDETEATATLVLTIDEMKAVREKSPATCLALVNGQAGTIDQGLLPAELQARYAQNTAAAFEQIGAHPAPPVRPMTTGELNAFAQAGFHTLLQDTQTLVLPLISGRAPQTYAEVRGMCDLYLAMLDQLVHGPEGSVRGFMAMAASR